jgi:hypothetical protein
MNIPWLAPESNVTDLRDLAQFGGQSARYGPQMLSGDLGSI